MFIGMGLPVPEIANIPGPSRPGYPGGGSDPAFIMRVQTDISTASSFKSNDDQFQIVVFTGTGGGTFDYNVDWGDGNTDSNVTGNITHTYASIGTYDVKITGSFPNIYFFNRYDRHKVLEIKNWGTGEWEYMRNAFYGCTNMVITATDQPDFSRIDNFYRAFTGCTNMTLPSPDHVSNWVSSNCISIDSMFSNCDSITSLDCSGWDVSNVLYFQYAFTQMDNITEIDMTGWDTTNGSSFYQTFYLAKNLTSLPGIEDFRFRTNGIVDLQFMFRDLRVFYGNNNDGVLDLSGWNITSTNVANIRNMFRNMYEIKRIDMSTWDMSGVTNLSQMFLFCYDLETINGIENWDVSNCTQFPGIFQGCRNLDADVSSWDTSSGVNFNSALYSLSVLDTQRITGWSNWDVSNSNTTPTTGGGMAYIFSFSTGNSLLSDGFPSNWNIGNATSLWSSFRRARYGQTNIACNITTTSGLANCYTAFMEIGRYGADSITFNSNFDVSGVTDARYMFASNSQPISAEFGISFPSGTDWGSVTTFQNFLINTTLSSADYNALLIDIEASNQNNNVIFDAPLCVATGAGLTARNALINDHSWTINDNS